MSVGNGAPPFELCRPVSIGRSFGWPVGIVVSTLCNRCRLFSLNAVSRWSQSDAPKLSRVLPAQGQVSVQILDLARKLQLQPARDGELSRRGAVVAGNEIAQVWTKACPLCLNSLKESK